MEKSTVQPQAEADIRAAAEAELAQMRGAGTNAPDAGNVKPSGDAAETEPSSDAASQAKEEAEPEAAEKKEKSPEKEEDDSTEKIRKEAERAAKKKYLSQVNRLQKELAEKEAAIAKTAESYKNGEVDDMKAIAEAAVTRKELAAAEQAERKELFASVPDFKKHEAEIDAVKEQFPNMSIEQAAHLWAAQNKPELLVKKGKPASMEGSLPKSATAEQPKTEADQRSEAMEYLKKTSTFFTGR